MLNEKAVIKDKVPCLLDVSSGKISMPAYVCLSIVCSARLFIAFGTALPSWWQEYRLYRFREQSVFLRVLYYNVPDIRCRKKLEK